MNASEKNKIPVAAIVGRPNVGKSTFFNRLIRRRKAITDPTPGVTRDPVSHIYERNGLKVKLIDTGGVRLSKEGLDPLVSSRSRETAMCGTYQCINDVCRYRILCCVRRRRI